MQVSAKSDYALRAAVTLAAAHPETVSAQALASAQCLPAKFTEVVLADLRRAGLVRGTRGAVGGYQLTRPPSQIVIGEILRAVDGPLASVRGLRPEKVDYHGAAEHLPELWVAVRAAVRNVVDDVTVAQLADGTIPLHVRRLTEAEDAWLPR